MRIVKGNSTQWKTKKTIEVNEFYVCQRNGLYKICYLGDYMWILILILQDLYQQLMSNEMLEVSVIQNNGGTSLS